MYRGYGRRRPRPGGRRRDAGEVRVLGLVMMMAGLVLLFLCIPGWAWAVMIGAALVAAGYFLLTCGQR